MDSNRGWDTTSDEDDGMEIDLDSKQEDANEERRSVTEEQDLNGREMSQTDGLDYDPAEPTDDYDPSQPTPEEGDTELCRDTTFATEAQGPSLVADYDPADPTLSDEEKDDNENDTSEQAQPHESKTDEEDSFDGRWNSQLETFSPEDIPLPKDMDSGSEFAKDEGTPTKDEITKHQDTSQEEDENRKDEESTVEKMTEIETGIEEGSRLPTESRSPSPLPTDTDENTQMSFADGANSDVPEVTIDESDFVLEKELFEPAGDQNKSLETEKSTMESENQRTYEGDEASQDGTLSRNQESRGERVEKTRTQEEVDSRNEEALVDLFREESDPDRLENDLEQPLKKTKKKVGTKKLKKKGKKLKKGANKKGQNKDVEDQRFVELRGDRQSIESQEEGEVDAGGHGNSWADLEDRLAPGKERSSEQLYDVNQTSGSYLEGGDDTEQREPGEIVEESMKRKSGKKRDREKKRKKKSKREVATIEEGALGDEDSQKFPSFLAGFFVQDEDVGEEDLADKLENMSHSFEAEEERTFQKGGKTYRKRHDSGAEDSVKSGEEAVAIGSLEARVEEADHRKGRSHDERQHGSRERRHEGRDGRDGRREKENRHAVPREKEREKARDRDRSRHDRERVRDRENRDREVVRERDRERDRSRRGEREERRRRHTSRSGSRERRRRSGSAERNWRSRSRDRSVRHRRHRSRSQERDRERERARRTNRERSRERESERRGSGRRGSRSRSRSPRHRSERGSSNKENREDSRSSRRRVVSRTQQEASGSEEREGSHRMSHRRQQREKERDRERQRERSSSSSSSSSSNSTGSSPSEQTENSHRQQRSHRDQYRGEYPNDREHHHHRHRHRNDLEPSTSDEGASSDVILVEPEKIVINLDEEEDPPSRVDITLANAEDDSTTMVDGESIPPPPDLTQTTRASALIEITQEAVASSALDDQTEGDDQEEGDATPTRDERSDKVSSKQPQRLQKSVQDSAAEVGDYDPAHPTEEGEDKDSNQPPIPAAPSEPTAPAPPLPTEQAEDIDSGPVPPSHPPPQEIRPSPPPVPAMPEPSIPERPNQFPNPQFSQPQPPLPLLGQQPPGFPPAWNVANTPNGPNMSGFNNQRGLLPTPDIQPLFPLRTEDSRQQTPFSSQQGRREQQSQNQPPVPISAMAPLAQLHSLLPALERAKMSSRQTGDSAQGVKEQSFHVPPPAGAFMKAPLMSNPAQNIRPPRGGRGGGGDLADSTEVVDMDMSPGEDDCELELPSPHSSDSDREERRRKGRKSDTRSSRTAGNTGGSAGKPGGPIQPVVYLKALKKVIEKMTPKGQPAATGGSSQEKGKPHERRRRRPVELTAEDDVPTSAVELTNKEKYLKKLHLQERVIDEVKLAIKPFYSSKKINKDQYKLILRKAVPKVCHSKSERINPQKIQQLVEAYVGKLAKGSTLGGKPGGHSGKKKKASGGPANKDTSAASAAPHGVRQNGERGKKPNR